MMDMPEVEEHNDGEGEDAGMYSPASPGDNMALDDGPVDALPMAAVYGKNVIGVEGAMGVPPDEPAGETPSPRAEASVSAVGGGSYGCGSSEAPIDNDTVQNEPMSRADEHFIYQFTRDLGGDPDRTISEMYSPPRLTAAARKLPHLQLVPGFALDLRTCDENGVAWNFDVAERRDAARKKFHEEKPMFLVGTPMCTRWCSWQHINDAKRDPVEVRRELVQAQVHLAFMCELYQEQHDAGRYFLHEHPAGSGSWNEDCVKQVMQLPGVDAVVGDRCQYGQEADGEPVRKATRFMSNSEEVLKRVKKRCQGRDGN